MALKLVVLEPLRCVSDDPYTVDAGFRGDESSFGTISMTTLSVLAGRPGAKTSSFGTIMIRK